MPRPKQTAVGIDGCRGGWVASICRPDDSMNWLLEARIVDILQQIPKTSTVLVDMIIGLPDQQTQVRQCDLKARKMLSPHGSRVFPAPPREALAAESYPAACEQARAATGKAISKQCWNLFPKIRELDTINDPRIRESHPELVFARLNNGAPVASSKKTGAGQTERRKLLNKAMASSADAFLRIKDRLGSGGYLADDCIDALALCIAARQPQDLTGLSDEVPNHPTIWY